MTNAKKEHNSPSERPSKKSGRTPAPLSTAPNIIEQLLEATNLSARGLAEMIHVSPSTITRIKKSETCPSYDDMIEYADRAGFKIVGNKIERSDHLKGYYSAKEIGDIVNRELEGGLDSEKLQLILRVMPKLVYDWNDLEREDIDKMMLAKPQVRQKQWQAVLEGIVQFFSHSELWEEEPKWTNQTSLREMFVPRAATREIGNLWMRRMSKRRAPEFMRKNVLFTKDEMQMI